MQDRIKKDWRDRTATKVAAGVVAGALIIGSAYGLKRAFEYQREQFCQQYSLLKDKPSDIQRTAAKQSAEEMVYTPSDRIFHVNKFLSMLRNCPEVKTW